MTAYTYLTFFDLLRSISCRFCWLMILLGEANLRLVTGHELSLPIGYPRYCTPEELDQ